MADSSRCALQRLSEKPYDPVGQREEYDAVLSLYKLEETHRIKVYKETYMRGAAPRSSLDQLLQDIHKSPNT